MRPHTRTQCNNHSHSGDNCDGGGHEAEADLHNETEPSTSGGAGGCGLNNATGAKNVSDSNLFLVPSANLRASSRRNRDSSSITPPNTPHVPNGGSAYGMMQYKGGYGGPGSIAGESNFASNMSSISEAESAGCAIGEKRPILIVELPAEILVKILNYLPFSEISHLRLVSRRFNELCASVLNSTFQKLQTHMLQRFHEIKSKMPRRESARRNHPLARESDIIETLHMRLTLLQMTFGKHIERKHICFFAGEILDEVHRIMYYIKTTPNLGKAFKVTDELFDLSTMAMEYFKEKLEPTLPEITFFGAGDFLDFTTPFTNSPTKQRSRNGSVFGASSAAGAAGNGVDSSVAGSVIAESTYSDLAFLDDDEDEDAMSASAASSAAAAAAAEAAQAAATSATGSNMVLRKRIRSIRKGMKRYNNELVEVKRELKSCKNKMENQTKQVYEYSQRLEEYDKKFEESSRKFQTLLSELNKCKTELQFWRSRSTAGLSGGCRQCANAMAMAAAAAVNAAEPSAGLLLFGQNQQHQPMVGVNAFAAGHHGHAHNAANSDADEAGSVVSYASSDGSDLRALVNQGVFPNEVLSHRRSGGNAGGGHMCPHHGHQPQPSTSGLVDVTGGASNNEPDQPALGSPRPVTRNSITGGPPSPVPAGGPSTSAGPSGSSGVTQEKGRKRKAAGQGHSGHHAAGKEKGESCAATTRSATKRPKVI